MVAYSQRDVPQIRNLAVSSDKAFVVLLTLSRRGVSLMGEFLKRFWGSVVSLAGLFGAYFAVVPLHLVWAFWLVCGAAALIATFSLLGPRSLEIATRIRNYPVLLENVAIATAENDGLQQQLKALKSESEEKWKSGLKEGRKQIIGSMAALRAGPLDLKGVAVSNGRLLVVADTPAKKPLIGARYFVESALTGDIMGVVEVTMYNEIRRSVFLECIDRRDSIFWERLSEAAQLDSRPPEGLQLKPYTVTSREQPGAGTRPVPDVVEGA